MKFYNSTRQLVYIDLRQPNMHATYIIGLPFEHLHRDFYPVKYVKIEKEYASIETKRCKVNKINCIFGLRGLSLEYRVEFNVTEDITLNMFSLLLYASFMEDNCLLIIKKKNFWFSSTIHEPTYIMN